jgi:LPS sulfotransferase NodH
MTHPKRNLQTWKLRFILPHLPLRYVEYHRRRSGRAAVSHKVLIFAQGRTGSTALQSCFPADSTLYMREPLGPLRKPWNADWLPNNPADFLTKWALRAAGRKTAVVAHVKPEHLRGHQHVVVPFLQEMVRQGWQVVHLERQDSFNQGISFLRARELRVFNTEDADVAEATARRDVFLAPEAVRAAIWRNEVLNHFNRELLTASGIPFIRTTYEALLGPEPVAEPERKRLATALSLPFALQPPTTKKVGPSSPGWEEVRQWYEKHVAPFKPTD